MEELIIEECNLPGSTDSYTMANIFEESVRTTFNASSPPTHQFNSGSHSQFTNPVDGYSTAAFDLENGEQLNVVTSIIETKFSEDPSGLMSSGQSQTHIDDLAASYNMIPSDNFSGAPLYVLVSNSQRPVDEIGRYSYGATSDLPSYANERDVNMIHFRVMRTLLSRDIKLEGDILGDAQTTRSMVQDFLGD